MPLAKGRKKGKSNQGAQWGDTGPAGNIHHLPRDGATDKAGKSKPKSGKRGRNKSIGR